MRITSKITTSILTISLNLLSFIAIADAPLHTFPESGITINATKHVKELFVKGNYITFKLNDKATFAVAMVFKDNSNPYPLLEEFSAQFVDQIYGQLEHQVFEKLAVEKAYANSTSEGIEYLIDVEETNCELYLASAVGEKTYIFFTISNEINKGSCKDNSQSLKAEVDAVVNSISLSVQQ